MSAVCCAIGNVDSPGRPRFNDDTGLPDGAGAAVGSVRLGFAGLKVQRDLLIVDSSRLNKMQGPTGSLMLDRKVLLGFVHRNMKLDLEVYWVMMASYCPNLINTIMDTH